MVSKGRFVQVKAAPMDTIRTMKNAISRLAEESIRLQELAAMVRRGKLAGNEADNLKMPFAEQYPVLSITAPKDGGGNKRGSFLPYAVKFTWNSLPVVKQQQFINHVLGYWKSLEKTNVSRIIMRPWRIDADRDRSVYIQFLEPDNVSQFKHLGKIKMSVLVGESQVFKTDFAPVKAGVVYLGEAGVDARKSMYGINISLHHYDGDTKGHEGFKIEIGMRSLVLLGAQLSEWVFVPCTAKKESDNGVGFVHYTRIHGLVAEHLLKTGQTSLDMDKPYCGVIKFESMPKGSLSGCSHCGSFGRHEAYKDGLPSCDSSGYCQFCGIETQRATYAIHEKECPDKGITKRCFRCKATLGDANHSPLDVNMCGAALEARAKADRRRREFQLYFNSKLEREFLKIADEQQEDGAKLLRYRSRVHSRKEELEKYVSRTRKLVESLNPHLKTSNDEL